MDRRRQQVGRGKARRRHDNQRAKAKAEGAEGRDIGDVDRRQALRHIDAVTDRSAGDQRQPDIVGKRIGDERGQRRRAVAQLGVDHHQAQNFVTGQRQIGQRGESRRDPEGVMGNKGKAFADLVQAVAAQLVTQRPQRQGEQAQREQRPD